uniref:Endonuclease/exonuclease/phosphatase domain-containing protein n=1 Tax=Hordeum vulgare subsp. vulgare TaxID=112509 RepID=A0A8I6WKI3_HORVV
MYPGPQIVVWNVRGLNSRARRCAIRWLLCTTRASIVCLQETRMALICSSIVLDTLGSEFDGSIYLPTDGTRGGILIAWKSRVVTIFDPLFTQNAITVKVCVPSGAPWWLTTVYGPKATQISSCSCKSCGTFAPPARAPGCFAAISTSSTATRTRTLAP